MLLAMLETNFAGASCAARPARIETHSPSNSTAPKNSLVFRRGASCGQANDGSPSACC
jgi:hypothetical protein